MGRRTSLPQSAPPPPSTGRIDELEIHGHQVLDVDPRSGIRAFSRVEGGTELLDLPSKRQSQTRSTSFPALCWVRRCPGGISCPSSASLRPRWRRLGRSCPRCGGRAMSGRELVAGWSPKTLGYGTSSALRGQFRLCGFPQNTLFGGEREFFSAQMGPWFSTSLR